MTGEFKMKFKQIIIIVIGIGLAIFFSLAFFYLLPAVDSIYTSMKVYETRVAIRDNYTLHTTPLSKNVVKDICHKLGIIGSNEKCGPGAVVYAPDFFSEVKTYFNSLSDQDKIYNAVQDKLDNYLISCEMPDRDGNYVCVYDLRGDGVYPITFFFNKDNSYYRIITTIGGS